jgi:septal ring factor EnvC (AmiA/AmiB activator)
VRSALLLRTAVPQIEKRVAALRRELRALAVVRGRLAEARGALKQTGVSLDRRRGQLAALLERKTRLVAEVRSEGRAARLRIESLGAEARDLRDLLARLSAARRAGDKRQAALRREQKKFVLIPPRLQPRPVAPPAKRPVKPLAKPPPTVLEAPPPAVETAGLPARGRVILMFGQQDGLGRPAKGITIETRRAAQVIAPRGGEVVFAGPFRGFGNLLIIEHRAGYHILLAGLARIDAAVGDRVLAGEPVGIMDVQTDGKPSLYVELRRSGDPINPLPWLAAGRTRIKG